MREEATRGQQLATAASTFIGVRFQLRGRDPRVGVDCVGLVVCSLHAIGYPSIAPTGYSLRNSDHSRWISYAKAAGLELVHDQIKAGDILLIAPGPGQQHLVIVESPTSIIHAHAGLRKVVRQPMDQGGRTQAHWRLSTGA